MRQLRHAVRTLLRTPFLTAVAVLSLALGTGANAAIFSMFDATLFDELPARAPDELVNLLSPGPKPGSQSTNMGGDSDRIFSYPMFRDLEREQTVFTGIARAPQLRCEPRTRWADHQQPGDACLRQLFSGAGSAAGARATLHTG